MSMTVLICCVIISMFLPIIYLAEPITQIRTKEVNALKKVSILLDMIMIVLNVISIVLLAKHILSENVDNS